MNNRKLLKIVAKAIIKNDYSDRSCPVDAVAERIDDDYPEYREYKLATLQGAIRSAARELDRYDAAEDRVDGPKGPSGLQVV